jgi:uncharacterized protein (TIGR03000 family)
MHRYSLPRTSAVLALGVLVAMGGSASAQGTAIERYPYWGSAPSSYGAPAVPAPSIGGPTSSYSGTAFGSSSYRSGSLLGSGAAGPHYSPAILAEIASLLPGSNYNPYHDAAQIWLRVPADAEVWFDGKKTRQSGTLRHYFSPPLTPGKTYSYDVRVRWTKDGRSAEEKRHLRVQANQQVRVELP